MSGRCRPQHYLRRDGTNVPGIHGRQVNFTLGSRHVPRLLLVRHEAADAESAEVGSRFSGFTKRSILSAESTE